MGRLLLPLVVWVAARRWAVALLMGIVSVGAGRFIRSNADAWSRDVVTKYPYGGSGTKAFDPELFESYREGGLCLIAFGLLASVAAVTAWVWRQPTAPLQLSPSVPATESSSPPPTDF